MAQVPILINGKTYTMACEDGQEERLLAMAKMVDEKAKEIASAAPNVGEARTLMMTALMLADELETSRADLEKAGTRAEKAKKKAEEKAKETAEAAEEKAEGDKKLADLSDHVDNVSGVLEKLSDRIETVARTISRT